MRIDWRTWLTGVFFLVLPSLASSQVFGGNPPSVKWKQINTDTARVIFPAGLDSQAQRVSALVHYMAAHPSPGESALRLGDRLYKINIVLQNQTTIANAYVALGPYRSEFFLTPAMNNFDEGTIPWIDQLAIHEYRHVQQFNNFRTGLSGLARTLFGEDGLTLAVNGAVPDWFFEGDAVYNETILSRQGRGRIPLFLNAYPSLWKAGKQYNWMKLRNGSMKDYVPNHYYLGYLLVNYGREKYGIDFWSRVTRDAAAYKGLFYPFQRAVRTHAGIPFKQFYRDAFAQYRQSGTAAASRMNTGTDGQPILPVNRRVVNNYYFPFRISADSLLYLRTAYDRRPAFYLRDSSGEHQIRVRDISTDQQYSYRNGKIVYAAYSSDLRWGWRDYSDIRLLDLQTHEQRTITRHAKYFSPDIAPSGEYIAAASVNTSGHSEIHILRTSDGSVASRIHSGEIALFTDPRFVDEQHLVTIVRLPDGRSALALADIASGSLERLTPPSYNVAGYPSVDGDRVFFTASYGGNDDIFLVRLADKKIFRVTQGSTGHYFVNASNGRLTWSNFTAEGYQLAAAEEKDLALVPLEPTAADSLITRFPVSHQGDLGDILLSNTTAPRQTVSRYPGASRLLNFHSWRPYYENPEFTFTFYGQNVLNTAQAELYYLYNRNDGTHATGFNFIYGALFPFLSAGTQYTYNQERVVSGRLRQWGQLDSRVGISFPFSWTQGRTYNLINFGSSYVYRNEFLYGANKALFSPVQFSYLSHFIAVGQQVQAARQHIYPRWGYALNFAYRHAITNYTSWQPLFTSSFYLPGFLPTHSIVLQAAFQETDTLHALFSNRFPYPRGYNAAYFARMLGGKANYHFPVLYPDFGFGNLVYFHRLRANLFYDYMKVYSRDKTRTAEQRSVGGELFVDTNWWNQYPLTFGIRVSRLLDNDLVTRTKSTVFEFVMPVSILPR